MWAKGIRGQVFSNVVEHGVSSLLAVLSWRVPTLDFPSMVLPEGGWKGIAVVCQDIGWVPPAWISPCARTLADSCSPWLFPEYCSVTSGAWQGSRTRGIAGLLQLPAPPGSHWMCQQRDVGAARLLVAPGEGQAEDNPLGSPSALIFPAALWV